MTATQQPVGVELIEVDPHTLDVGKNVRDQVDLEATPGFVASVREHGVLHPITANRREDGVLVVIDGQRRTFPGQLACCAVRCCLEVYGEAEALVAFYRRQLTGTAGRGRRGLPGKNRSSLQGRQADAQRRYSPPPTSTATAVEGKDVSMGAVHAPHLMPPPAPPVEVASADKQQHRLSRAGDRAMNSSHSHWRRHPGQPGLRVLPTQG
ncbi:ParB/Srx family N-terminal domain-containing protein [Rhodococcus opacus]|uniref:ParB/Srx family N-terminal domain-containing protein n=1 Tax=Rhodococcus opacus TaxID=37919 RepID=UPI001F57034C|nr:ParB/Srx family N-terminal domain-containing protein [Rhodococcus opacus]UNN05313.1 ParB/Srx family N-terminal domain-containing protein [Rhodococcus opacus]